MAVARYRDRHSIAGRKSELGDAVVLTNVLRTDAHAHWPLPADTELAQAIAVLARAQRDAVWARTAAHNKLRSRPGSNEPAAVLRDRVPALHQRRPHDSNLRGGARHSDTRRARVGTRAHAGTQGGANGPNITGAADDRAFVLVESGQTSVHDVVWCFLLSVSANGRSVSSPSFRSASRRPWRSTTPHCRPMAPGWR
jgi:Transposase